MKLRKTVKSSDNVTELLDNQPDKAKVVAKGTESGEVERSSKPLE